jgi:CheY-like chemotaxis protein
MDILALDDDHASCLLLRKMITSLGYTCDFVHNVADGLRAAACKDYALVLIDSFLPDNSGLVAFSAIKLLPREGPAPAFIGIMSCHNEQMQCQLVSAGMAGVLVKPFYRTAVGERIGQILHQRDPITYTDTGSILGGEVTKVSTMKILTVGLHINAA